ncbi:CAP domain-containing protein, partial [Collinsella aerofaciens]
AYEQAQQTEADKKAEYDKLVEVRKQKRSEWEAACAASNAAEKAYDAANAQVEALEQQIADLKSNMTVDQEVISQGMFGFMNYIIGGSQFTATQKQNAQDAVSMLTGADDKAEWYDKYVDQDMSRDTNPLSLEQMRNALTYLDTQNNLRKANGQSALSVSLRMTVAAALNTSYSSNIWGHSNCYFDNGENLADGGGAYTGGETEDTLGWPYTGLYTQEKVNYENWIKKYGVDSEAGKDLMAHRYDSYYIYQNYYDVYHGTKDKNGNQRGDACGHYLNIIDAGTKAIGIATGSGKNTDSEVTIFDYSSFDSEADFTVSEFKKLLNDYIDSAYNAGGTQAQKAQLKELQGKLAEAQKNFGTTREAYFAAVNGQDAAQDAFTAADVNMNTAKGEYEKAQSATAAAKSAYTAAEAKLKGIDVKTPKTKLNAAKGEAATAQAALDKANVTLADGKAKATDAAAQKAKARSARDAAKVKSDQAKEAYDNATASVKDLAAKCDAAKTDLANKQGTLDDAKKADDTAQAGVDKAQAADVRAATALSGAKQAVAAKTQALSDAQAKAKAAEDELATANKAFERFAGAQKAVDDAKVAYDAAVAGVADAQKQLEAANEAVVDANFEIVKAKAELASDEALKADLEAVDHKASLAAGTTGNEKLVKLNAAYARYKTAVDAAAGLKAALSDADAKLSDANDAYAAALAELNDAKDALAAAQAEYDKYHPKAEPQAKPQVAQAAAKAPVAKKKATSAALAQTGDDSALAGEVFVIGGITLVAAGVTLSDRRRKQM